MNPSIWHLMQAGILGLVQGLTEFIPVSSSGHLVIARELMKIEDPGNFFDAILHLATLLAILIFFFKDWRQMLIINKDKPASKNDLPVDRKLLGLIIVATIPALAIGYFAQGWIENNFRSLVVVAILLIAMGAGFIVSGYLLKPAKYNRNLSFWDAINIGLAQAVALLPGFSRSGSTMLTGMYVGLTRESAVKFSFLLAAPAMFVAGGYSLYQAIKNQAIMQDYWYLIIAFVTAFLSGWLVIGWLLKFFQKHSLDVFGVYSIIAGIALLVYHFAF
ncbi:undecaprenyl-diphosphate phosphatase [Patescibacteria group bacterium]|nr:undecaprenyl-diphosphate phosphatase [Patescibacteria group bacterium]